MTKCLCGSPYYHNVYETKSDIKNEVYNKRVLEHALRAYRQKPDATIHIIDHEGVTSLLFLKTSGAPADKVISFSHCKDAIKIMRRKNLNVRLITAAVLYCESQFSIGDHIIIDDGQQMVHNTITRLAFLMKRRPEYIQVICTVTRRCNKKRCGCTTKFISMNEKSAMKAKITLQGGHLLNYSQSSKGSQSDESIKCSNMGVYKLELTKFPNFYQS